jgi:DNA (cytosine-5)-methyltransferase 1
MGRAFEVALAVDSDPVATTCYASNFGRSANVLTADVAELFEARLEHKISAAERSLLKASRKIDVLVGGPPCQGHSDLNNFSRRSDPKNGLFTVMARAARVLQPEHMIIENVPGSIHDVDGAVQKTAADLAKQGYTVSNVTLSLDRLGVPQKRKRLIVVATRRRNFAAEQLFGRYAMPERNLRWAIADLVDKAADSIFDEPSTPSKDNQNRIAYLFDNGRQDLPDSLRPPCHKNGRHSYKSVYGRMKWDEPAQTITSGFYSMCMGRYVHPSRRRTLTAHEAARIQFFPDYFNFSTIPVRTALARIIGNAVPMKLSYLATLELLK